MPLVETADGIETLRNLGIALIAGFLVGFEREWTQELEKQRRAFAGGRTFALIGFVGGLVGALSEGAGLAAAALAVIGALTLAGYWLEARDTASRGATTEMAILATFLLGLAAGRGFPMIAASGAVAVAIVLSLKETVVSWARALDRHEIHAALRFLAVALLVLPALPNAPMGPYGALNPRELWLMVVFISGLSFVGYWLVKILGAGRGALATGVVGGLASSTAATLSLSRFARKDGSAPEAIAAAIIMANVVMLARIGVILAAVSRPMLAEIAPALVAGAVAGAAIALVLWRRRARDHEKDAAMAIGNPFELQPALLFGALLAIISVASAWGADRFGAAGIYAVAAISGLADVDAITLSAGRQAAGLGAFVAAAAVLIAAAANIAVKGALALLIGGRACGLPAIAAFAAIVAAGAAAFLLG
jgi:uncharacterized membrane protein (DUF4010 family)